MADFSGREREVLAGRTNKEVGQEKGTSPRTAEIYWAHGMQRLGAETVPDAVRIAGLADPALRLADEDP